MTGKMDVYLNGYEVTIYTDTETDTRVTGTTKHTDQHVEAEWVEANQRWEVTCVGPLPE